MPPPPPDVDAPAPHPALPCHCVSAASPCFVSSFICLCDPHISDLVYVFQALVCLPVAVLLYVSCVVLDPLAGYRTAIIALCFYPVLVLTSVWPFLDVLYVCSFA